MRVHIMDGTFELFRAYYGAPSLKSPEKQEVGATRTFMRGLYNLLHSGNVSHIGVAFDTTIESFRNKLYAGYKTGEGIDPDLYSQFPLVEKVAEALGVVVWRMKNFEADDALAAAAAKFSKVPSVKQVVIATPDKDLAQCVQGSKVIMWDRIRETTLNESGVKQKFGVGPKSIPDLLALVGDTADGIPGLPGWGMKSASVVLHKYKQLENIPKDFQKWTVKVRGAEKLSATLNTSYKDALLYKKLATLRVDVPLKEGICEMKWSGVNVKKLIRFSEGIGDVRFAEKVRKEQS